jgi:putative ABC transport system permease protein
MAAIDAELPEYDFAPLAERLARQTDKARFQVVLIGVFTGLAIVLAAVGVYGVISYSVAQRRREVAIRLSLGADRGSILRLVVGRGARLAAAGVALGLAAVFASQRPLSGLLFETSVADPLVVGATCLALFAVTLVANYLPARRAAHLDPMAVLRLQ